MWQDKVISPIYSLSVSLSRSEHWWTRKKRRRKSGKNTRGAFYLIAARAIKIHIFTHLTSEPVIGERPSTDKEKSVYTCVHVLETERERAEIMWARVRASVDSCWLSDVKIQVLRQHSTEECNKPRRRSSEGLLVLISIRFAREFKGGASLILFNTWKMWKIGLPVIMMVYNPNIRTTGLIFFLSAKFQ